MLTNYQKAAALYCNTALGCIDAIKQQAKPKSAEWNRLTGAEEVLNRCLDTYRIERFPLEDAQNAAKLLDLMNQQIAALYPAED
jgi:hypothetical protein